MTEGLDFFVHEKAICETRQVGQGTRIWAFAHVLPGASIGANCNVCAHVFIENDVRVGNNVTVKSGVQLWDGIEIEDDVFIGPNATFTNDRFPRSKRYPEKYAKTLVERGATIGANATLLPGIKIGADAMVGAGAVVTKDVPPCAVVAGNPAQIINYTLPESADRDRASVFSASDRMEAGAHLHEVRLGVGDCALLRLPSFEDIRGRLTAIEHDTEFPFITKRSFLVYSVPSNRVRGEHAHRNCKQILIAIHGSISVFLDDTVNQAHVRLDGPSIGLYVPEKIWAMQHRFSSDGLLLVYASHAYDADDYIRSYKEYAHLMSQR